MTIRVHVQVINEPGSGERWMRGVYTLLFGLTLEEWLSVQVQSNSERRSQSGMIPKSKKIPPVGK